MMLDRKSRSADPGWRRHWDWASAGVDRANTTARKSRKRDTGHGTRETGHGRPERIHETQEKPVLNGKLGDVHEATIAHRCPLRVLTAAITADLVVWT